MRSEKCPRCGGRGIILEKGYVNDYIIYSTTVSYTSWTCMECKGTGHIQVEEEDWEE